MSLKHRSPSESWSCRHDFLFLTLNYDLNSYIGQSEMDLASIRLARSRLPRILNYKMSENFARRLVDKLLETKNIKIK